MSNRTLRLQRADEETIAYVETLLDKNGLPSDDVEPGRNRFYIGYDGDTRVGVGGVERHGTDGLLRSVVIERSARGTDTERRCARHWNRRSKPTASNGCTCSRRLRPNSSGTAAT